MGQVVLDDPVLDARHPFTRVFLLAEYWKKKYVNLKRSFTVRNHDLKTWPVYFEEILAGRLSFSIRDNLGRGFQKGDTATLWEWDPNGVPAVEIDGKDHRYTGRKMRLDISYVESSWGLQPGKVVIGFPTKSRFCVKEEPPKVVFGEDTNEPR